MEWIKNITIFSGFSTLIVLEIVLGIDNIIFIAIVSEKLPKNKRDKARVVGLMLALFMRFGLLFSIYWLATLNQPLFPIIGNDFSGRDLIMLIGGFFLLFQATIELKKRLEGKDQDSYSQRKESRFWTVVAQIVLLDALCSFDSVITAIGIVDNIYVIMFAICISIGLMLLASKVLTSLVNTHPNLVILCLSFLLIIGFSLVAEGFRYHIPKSYLYAAISFSIMIEVLNQLAHFNRIRFFSKVRPLRKSTASAVLRILNGNYYRDNHSVHFLEYDIFQKQERHMIHHVLGMAYRKVNSIMTSRHDIEYLFLNYPQQKISQKLEKKKHTSIVVTEDSSCIEPIGVIHTMDIWKKRKNSPLPLREFVIQPLIFPYQLTLLDSLEQFLPEKNKFAFVVDEFGSLEGIVTITDVIKNLYFYSINK